MPYRKKTLRQMPPETRKIAKLISELESVTRRLKNMLPILTDLEIAERAERRRREHYQGKE